MKILSDKSIDFISKALLKMEVNDENSKDLEGIFNEFMIVANEMKNLNAIKGVIRKQFEFCNLIAEDIILHNASGDIISYVKKWADIEIQMSGKTDASWIRVNFGEIYIYVGLDEDAFVNGKIKVSDNIKYVLDDGDAGSLIFTNSVRDFLTKLENLLSNKIEESFWDIGVGSDCGYFGDTPPKYIPFNEV